MEHQRVGVAQATGAQRPRHRGADAAAHPARRHGLHQHDQRKDEGHAGQRVGAKPAEKVGFAGVHRRLDGHDDDVGCGQAQQGPRDRALEEEAGLIGNWERDGRADGRGDGGGPDSATRHRSPRRQGRPPHADQPVVAGHVDVPRRMTREPVPSAVATGARPDAQHQPGGQDAEGADHEARLFAATIQAPWIWRSGVEPWGSDRDSQGAPPAPSDARRRHRDSHLHVHAWILMSVHATILPVKVVADSMTSWIDAEPVGRLARPSNGCPRVSAAPFAWSPGP